MLPVRFFEEAQLVRQQNMVLEFARRASRYLQAAGQVGVAASTATFRDVGWHRDAGPPKLVGQSVELVPRGFRRGFVDCQRQPVSFLPHVQRPEILYGRLIGLWQLSP